MTDEEKKVLKQQESENLENLIFRDKKLNALQLGAEPKISYRLMLFDILEESEASEIEETV